MIIQKLNVDSRMKQKSYNAAGNSQSAPCCGRGDSGCRHIVPARLTAAQQRTVTPERTRPAEQAPGLLSQRGNNARPGLVNWSVMKLHNPKHTTTPETRLNEPGRNMLCPSVLRWHTRFGTMGYCPDSETFRTLRPENLTRGFFIDGLALCDVTRSVLSVCLFQDKEPGGFTGRPKSQRTLLILSSRTWFILSVEIRGDVDRVWCWFHAVNLPPRCQPESFSLSLFSLSLCYLSLFLLRFFVHNVNTFIDVI